MSIALTMNENTNDTNGGEQGVGEHSSEHAHKNRIWPWGSEEEHLTEEQMDRDKRPRPWRDFRSSERNFEALLQTGKKYVAPPFPHDLAPFDPAHELLKTYKDKNIIEMMWESNVGKGTDPERLEHHLLNAKAPILDRCLFTTHAVKYPLHETYDKVHTLSLEAQVSKNNKIDFGVSGGYAQVSLGVAAVSSLEQDNVKRRIVGIIDQRYQWAQVCSHLRHECLHKYLDTDFEKASIKISDALDTLAKEEGEVPDENEKNKLKKKKNKILNDELPHRLTDFIRKYGTHLILVCTVDYRLEQRSETILDSQTSLENFRTGLHVAALDFARLGLSAEKSLDKMETHTKHAEGVRSVGSPKSVRDALAGAIAADKWSELCSTSGDAGNISHDKTMLIAEVVEPRYEKVACCLRFWTNVRVRDLQQGWDRPMFACAYKLKFAGKRGGFLWWDGKISKSGVHVLVQGSDYNDLAFHQRKKQKKSNGEDPGDTEEEPTIGYMTGVSSADVKKVTISTPDEKTPLKDVVSTIQIFLRVATVEPIGEGITKRIDVLRGRPTLFTRCPFRRGTSKRMRS